MLDLLKLALNGLFAGIGFTAGALVVLGWVHMLGRLL